MFSSRAVFLLGSLLALVGSTNAADSAVGACFTSTEQNSAVNGAWDSSTSAEQCKCDTGYASDNADNVLGDTTLTCVFCASGYTFTGDSGAGSLAAGICEAAASGSYWAGGFAFASAFAASDTETATACPTNSASVEGSDALTDCTVKPGYYIETKADGDADVTNLAISIVPANFYGAGGEVATTQVTNDVTATKLACPSNSASVQGSDALIDCTVKPGYYIETKADGDADVTNLAISIVPANFYGAGGEVATTQVANDVTATKLACPYAGTSAVLSDAVADCTPSCGTVAVAGSGTCACKAGRTGTPTPANAAVTGGCTATLCAVNKYVSSNVCTACAAGTKNALGDDASGADTACDATKCAVNEYVKSKVCTACTVGTTNTVGDDASGVDTECDVDAAVKASSASRSDISFATIAMVIATLLACAIV